MKTLKLPFILFFQKGAIATPAELSAASKIRGRIGYRNASVVDDNDATEPCDGVAGAVPKPYKKFPTAEKAIEAYDKQVDAAAKLVGDRPAPSHVAGATGKQGIAGAVMDSPAAAGTAPKGFDKLPGGDGSLGAPNAPAATPAAPAADAKPPAWPAGGKQPTK